MAKIEQAIAQQAREKAELETEKWCKSAKGHSGRVQELEQELVQAQTTIKTGEEKGQQTQEELLWAKHALALQDVKVATLKGQQIQLQVDLRATDLDKE